MKFDLTRRLAAEALGTFFLVMAVVGSGIMAEKLAGGNQAIALLCNTLPTGAVLFVIITIFVSVSGAQFNPAVTLVMLLRGEIKGGAALAYVAVKIAGGCLGAVPWARASSTHPAVRYRYQRGGAGRQGLEPCLCAT